MRVYFEIMGRQPFLKLLAASLCKIPIAMDIYFAVNIYILPLLPFVNCYLDNDISSAISHNSANQISSSSLLRLFSIIATYFKNVKSDLYRFIYTAIASVEI